MDILQRVAEENFLRNKWENKFDEIIYEMYKYREKPYREVFAPKDLMDYQHCQEKKGSVSQRLAYLVSIGLLEKPKRGEYMLVEGKPLNQLKMRLAKQQLRALWHKIYQVIPKLREQLDSKEQEEPKTLKRVGDLSELREQLDNQGQEILKRVLSDLAEQLNNPDEQLDSKEQERLEERLLSDLNELREQLDWDFS